MRVRSTAVVVAALAWLAVSVLPAAAQDMKVRGTVAGVAGSDLTVSVDGKDMTFHVDATTNVVARGGTTATKAAEAAGKAGATLGDVLKKGDRVEVTYVNMEGGMMHAKEVRAGVTASEGEVASGGDKPKSMSASGEVTAVEGNSLTVKSGDDSWTFAVSGTTNIIARGGTTATKAAEAAGKAGATLADVVGVGDQVEVHYADEDGRKVASEVRVTRKKM